jgi:hypothetical protein
MCAKLRSSREAESCEARATHYVRNRASNRARFSKCRGGTSYGTPALKVNGKLFVRLREDPDSLVIKMPFDQREELMAGDPETYYITDHYREYEWMLVRLSKVREEALKELLQIAYRAASPPKRVVLVPGRPARRRRS